jgi:imidazoleglycerol-phosphate dehydratase / histidinol-phosphatase
MKKILFIDRDGTIIHEPENDQQVDSLEKLSFIPYAISALQRISRMTDYELVMVSNQDGLGTSSYPEETFWPAHRKMLEILKGEGVEFSAIHIDRSFEHEMSPNRKPGTGMLQEYIDGPYDLKNSYVIGDRLTDVTLAVNLGSRAILYGKIKSDKAALNTSDWNELADFLIYKKRKGRIERKTNETDILVDLNLDGTGKCDIHTGLGFFDHMLEQIGRHGDIDLKILVKGDLHVDEHHTIEDTAIALGETFSQALGDKKGIRRYGFLLPMDDALAQVAIDFGGRPWLEWDAEFRREKIGDMPAEMFFHFFKSFCDNARCNLNVKAVGTNEHHKIESIFKAFAKAVKMAVKRDEESLDRIPSTKGIL